MKTENIDKLFKHKINELENSSSDTKWDRSGVWRKIESQKNIKIGFKGNNSKWLNWLNNNIFYTIVSISAITVSVWFFTNNPNNDKKADKTNLTESISKHVSNRDTQKKSNNQLTVLETDSTHLSTNDKRDRDAKKIISRKKKPRKRYYYRHAFRNLVPNSSFESFEKDGFIINFRRTNRQTTTNEATIDVYNYIEGWELTYGYTSCYFNLFLNNLFNNSKDSSGYQGGFGVPNNWFGHQEPKTGEAYVGIHNGYGSAIQCKLKEPLMKDSLYHVGFHVSLGEKSNCAIYDIGAYISAAGIASKPRGKNKNKHLYRFKPQVKNNKNNYITDTENWTKISGVYKAKGGEEYILIGTFKPFDKIEKAKLNEPCDYECTRCLYYIDDVFVIPEYYLDKSKEENKNYLSNN